MRRSSQPSKVAVVHKWSLSASKLKALPDTDRYVFVLVGHIYNELMALQKMLLIAKPPLDAPDAVKDAGVGLSMLMLKTLLGKTFEALETLKGTKVSDRLKTQYFHNPKHLKHWEEALDRFARADWLQTLRNQHSFHYMSEGQWRETLVDDRLFDGAYVILDSTHGNTFYQ